MLKKFPILCMFFLASCGMTSLPHDANKSIEDSNNRIESATVQMSQLQNAMKKRNLNYDADSIYISDTPIPRKNPGFLPPVFTHSIEIDQTVSSIGEISSLLNQITGYPVLLDGGLF